MVRRARIRPNETLAAHAPRRDEPSLFQPIDLSLHPCPVETELGSDVGKGRGSIGLQVDPYQDACLCLRAEERQQER